METVLLVDDNADLLGLFSVVLARSGYSVLTADGGEQCMAILREQLPDLVLLDIMMEPVDGWETLAMIRTDERTRRLPVIMVTGKQPTREEIRQHLAEIDGYVVKPLTIAELTGLVSAYFQRQKHADKRVQAARAAGAGETLVAEYWDLCRLIATGSSLSRVMPELAPDI